MPENSNVTQARMAWRYYVKGDRTIAFDPASRVWVPVGGDYPPGGPGPGDDPEPGLSKRALSRIAGIQDAERRGLIGHDAAEAEILTVIREET